MSLPVERQSRLLPGDYGQLLQSLKQRIRSAQLHAGMTANRELVSLIERSSAKKKSGILSHPLFFIQPGNSTALPLLP